MHLTSHLFAHVGDNKSSVIFETTQGIDVLDAIQLSRIIVKLRRMRSEIVDHHIAELLLTKEGEMLIEHLAESVPNTHRDFWEYAREFAKIAKKMKDDLKETDKTPLEEEE